MKKGEQKQDASKKGKEKDITELIQENIEMNQEMHHMLKSIKTYILMQRIWFGLKVLLILIPIILGVIYLPPVFQEWAGKYRDLLQSGSSNVLEKVLPGNGADKENFDQKELQTIEETLSSEQKRQLLQQLREQ